MRETEILRGLGRARSAKLAPQDTIPAWLAEGEAVLPEATVRAVGPQNIARLIEETNGVAPTIASLI